MKVLLFLLIATCSYGQCDKLVIAKKEMTKIGYVFNELTTVWNVVLDATGPKSVTIQTQCGPYVTVQCVNLPHVFETQDIYCPSRYGNYIVSIEGYSGTDCTGQKCFTSPFGEVVKQIQPVKKMGNVLSFAPDVKEVEVINSSGVSMLRQKVKGDISLDVPRGIYFIRTRGTGYSVSKVVL